MVKVKAILFDLYGTLVHLEKSVTDEEIADYLFQRQYEVSPQTFKAAWSFVAFVDYPKHGYGDWRSYLSRVFWRLRVKIDAETLKAVAERYERNPYKLHPDAVSAVGKAKTSGFKTAIVTTIAHFKFKDAIQPIREQFDFVMTGYEAGCDKSNPRMYGKVLEILDVKPEEAAMIGDDMQIDIILPKSLGMRTVLLNREGKHPNCPQADAIATSLDEAVETVIRKLHNT